MIFKNDKVYEVLKWIALVVLPAMAVLYGGLGQLWPALPYVAQITGTLSLVATFIGTIVGVSSIRYKKQAKAQDDEVDV